MIFDKGLRGRHDVQNIVTADSIGLPGLRPESCSASNAMRLADVSRCIDILSDDMAKLPWFLMNEESKNRSTSGNILYLLRVRPNEAMTPFVAAKMLETNVLSGGNGYFWIYRNKMTMEPEELIPVPWQLADCHREKNGFVWYSVTNPYTGELMKLHSADMIHIKGFSEDGLKGISVLHRARDVITSGIAAQEFQKAFYQNGGQPGGILKTEADLSGQTPIRQPDGTVVTISKKDYVRAEWERIHRGPNNAHRVAVLDYGVDYKPLVISQADAQFIETRQMSRVDMANFFGVPLYKLNDGKQAYSSNEQNNVDYCMSTLQPKVTQWEQEFSYKLLADASLTSGDWLRMNMMAALRGDTAARGAWYKTMREIGAFSVNDILGLEDMERVPGGDTRYASLNYTTLENFERSSQERNGGNNGKNQA